MTGSARQFFRPDIARDVDEELASHLAMHEEDLVARGLSRTDARETALRRFGNQALVARACREIDEQWYRDQRRASMWTDLRQDIGYAFRLLRRAPGFTTVAVITLALGIGATTAIFSLANWALLRPVPGVESPGELRTVWTGTRSGPNSFRPSFLSYPNFNDAAARLRTVSLGGYTGGSVSVATDHQAARPVPGVAFTSASYFEVLGVRTRAGRLYTPDEDNPAGGALVAVLSEPFAVSLFSSAAAAVGQTIRVNGLPVTVIGVAAAGFTGTDRIGQISLWLPGATYPAIQHFKTMRYDNRQGGFYSFVARPRDGATWPQIEAELSAVGSWLAAQYPKENKKFETAGFHVLAPIGTDPLGGAQMRGMVALMLGVSAIVLLIACSNVASLLLMRGIGRGSEVAVRKALGAGRLRLVRQHLTEGLVLWTAGGTAALGAVWIVTRLVDGATLLGLRAPVGAVPLDWRVIVFALALSLTVGLIFAVVPAIRASGADPAGTLREGSATQAPRKLRVGTALSAVQLALSLALVVSALLLAATVRQLSRVDLGFDPTNVYTFMIRPGSIGYSAPQAATYRDEFARRLRLVPGVEQVSLAVRAPFVTSRLFTLVKKDGSKEVMEPQGMDLISTGFFEALRIPLVRGRVFSEDDLGNGGTARPVVVVSEKFAQERFGTIEAVGREIEFNTIGRGGKRYQIIGVVGDILNGSLTADPAPTVYEPASLDGPVRPEATFLVRTRPGTAIEAAVRDIAAALNSALPVMLPRWMEEAIARERAQWDVLARLLTTLAVIAGVLAAVGLYGVIAFGVAARRREFGIRLALGAPPSQLVALVLRRTAAITAGGLVLGGAGAVALSRALQARLVGVTPFDPFVWTAATVILIALAFVASWLPARRAGSLPVVSVLRAN